MTLKHKSWIIIQNTVKTQQWLILSITLCFLASKRSDMKNQ